MPQVLERSGVRVGHEAQFSETRFPGLEHRETRATRHRPLTLTCNIAENVGPTNHSAGIVPEVGL